MQQTSTIQPLEKAKQSDSWSVTGVMNPVLFPLDEWGAQESSLPSHHGRNEKHHWGLGDTNRV